MIKLKSKLKSPMALKIYKYLIVIIIIILFVILPFIFIPRNTQKKGINNRAKNCLTVFNDPSYSVSFEPLIINRVPNKPYFLRDYYISSSYKSYMPCGHTNDVVSYNALVSCLSKGARFIHLDLYYDGEFPCDPSAIITVQNVIDGEPSVYPKAPQKYKYLNLTNCLNIIANKAWNGMTEQRNYPLLLYLELHFDTNRNLEKKIADALVNTLSTRFINKKYGFHRTPVGNIPMDELIGKVILLTNRRCVNDKLDEITNSILNNEVNDISNVVLSQTDINYGGIRGKYVKKDDAVRDNKFTLHRVVLDTDPNIINQYTPKYDIINIDPTDSFNYGMQIVSMNFQKYDDNLRTYLNTELNPNEYQGKTFSKLGFIPKPQNMIYIPQPPLTVNRQNPKLSLQSWNLNLYNGFFTGRIG